MQNYLSTFDFEDASDCGNLGLLVCLRWVAIAIQTLALCAAVTLLDIELPVVQMGAIIVALVTFNAFASWKSRRSRFISEAALFRAFVIDITALFCLLYLSGGVNNPFISLFLVQVIIGSVLMRDFRIWMLVALTTAFYVFLVFRYRPLDLPHAHDGDFLNLHLQGMFISHVVAAILVAFFLNRIHKNALQKDRLITEMQQRTFEEEQIVRMGLLASSAAHDLGTPLMTIDVMLGDWEKMSDLGENREMREDLAEMRLQINRCRDALTGILAASGAPRGEGTIHVTLKDFIDDIVHQWRNTKQTTTIEYANMLQPDEAFVSDSALRTIIRTVLDNAYEASSSWIGIAVGRINRSLTISVSDAGQGFVEPSLGNLGKAYNSTKNGAARGLGLFLAVKSVEKLGGYIEAKNGEYGGACVTICLPLDVLVKA